MGASPMGGGGMGGGLCNGMGGGMGGGANGASPGGVMQPTMLQPTKAKTPAKKEDILKMFN